MHGHPAVARERLAQLLHLSAVAIAHELGCTPDRVTTLLRQHELTCAPAGCKQPVLEFGHEAEQKRQALQGDMYQALRWATWTG